MATIETTTRPVEIAWQVSVKRWFTGPRSTLETPPAVVDAAGMAKTDAP